ncbi:hypothetical protein C8J35_103492 [Rhizobium sp. PP-F2F-G38]|nr:hypothetical protein C8J35_103492 [Rhizobium sp. PP-F2F-G38]
MFDLSENRILVAITFHYRQSRLQYLYQTMRAIAHYPVQSVDFHIFTNSADGAHHHEMQGMFSEMSETFHGADRSLSIHTVHDLSNPQHLTWSHKPLVREFVGSAYTHFIYTEDDHEITYGNFLYFLKYREALKPHGVYPGFQRIELNYKDSEVYSTDQFGKSQMAPRAKIEHENFVFMTMDNPYYGFFILDQDLALEYVNNRAFDIETSKDSFPWEVSERSAMALTYENVPDGFWVRPVVPITKAYRIASMACVRHLPNNYTNNPDSLLGKMPMAHVIAE